MSRTDRQPRFTFGMAHFDDYDGAYFTIQSIRAHHYADDVEILVVDNRPDSPHGEGVRNLVEHWAHGKYIPFPEAVGTSAPRDRVFREASAPTVICVDCHVLLTMGSLQAAMDWWDARPADSPDMLTGPLLRDDLGVLATHFNDQWRAEMWGTWGQAWRCPCTEHAAIFTTVELPDGSLQFRTVAPQQPITACLTCNRPLKSIPWAGHEANLVIQGYLPMADGPTSFEIPGMGLGLFSMRRDQWVGFHPEARGFGGEELYVHEKVRAAGGRVYCNPYVRWLHRFGRPGGVRYPLTRQIKVRNYVLEFLELGRDLEPIREHFVDSGWLSAAEWDAIVRDPVNYQPAQSSCGGGAKQPAASQFPQPPEEAHTLDTLFAWCKSQKRDLDQHADKIRDLAADAKHVTAVVKRREWDVYLLAGRPDDLVTWTVERDALHDTLHKTVIQTETNPRAARRIKNYTTNWAHPEPGQPLEIETDLLVIDDVHHADALLRQLEAWAPAVRRRIVLRGTQEFGEVAEGGRGPGLRVGMRAWMTEHPEWSVIYHSPAQYGLTVLSRDPADKPKLPGVTQLVGNFAKAMAEHVADGLHKVDAQQLQGRLEGCTLCDQRRDNRCAACGCYVQPKAALRSSYCPLGRWPE